MSKITPLFARQPIFNRKQEVIAYELLFRGAQTFDQIDGDQATAQVILKVFGENNLTDVTGGKKAFVNFTRNLILSPPILPREQLVVEVLEDIAPEPAVMAALQSLKKKRYIIALDDFLLTEESSKFIPFADIIKVDVLALSEGELRDHAKSLQKFEAKLLAEKVEDHRMMELCKSLGFHFFQGYFLCKPEVVKGVSISEGKQTVLKLISQLNDDSIDLMDIVQTIATDPALSYKILRLVNSSAIGLQREIESLSQAVTLLGVTAIRNWATFLLLANTDGKPAELCVITMCRAKLCETIGLEMGGKSLADSCFTAGLLTNIDAFLDMPMKDVLSKLKLSEPIEQALLHQKGKIGEILKAVLQYERGEWAKINWGFMEDNQITAAQLNMLYGSSIVWATQMVASQ